MQNSRNLFSPVAIFLLLILFSNPVAAQKDVNNQAYKFGKILSIIDRFYVDTVDVEKLTEDAIIKVLADLDPHSVYISPEEVQKMNEPLEGSFEGIGISFNIFHDTLMVVNPIPGGPSEKVGIRAGDRILFIDGKLVAGIGLKNSDVFSLLRGDKGTKVTVKILRKGEKELLEFTIVRDKIPIHSLDAAYMLDKTTGYIKLNRFSSTTILEFTDAFKELKDKNIENLILDLRGNGGGFLSAAIDLADHFLDGNKLIVFTEGTHSPKKEYKANSKGIFESGKIVILINEGSASASEIVSGAIQDWDRGVIIGRRSFGKGLVQQPFMLHDQSMIRLTTAHYYTPSGRSIQKPFEEGVEEYQKDFAKRVENGEVFSADSVHFADSLKYKTLINGRPVYGGGGIMPDIFVPMDTSVHYQYFNRLIRKQVLYNFVLDYMDSHREELTQRFKNYNEFNRKFQVDDEMIEKLVEAGVNEGVERDEESLKVTRELMKRQIKALIARDLWDMTEYFRIVNQGDEMIEKALDVIGDEKHFNEILLGL